MQLLLLLEGILLRNPFLKSDACFLVREVRLLLVALKRGSDAGTGTRWCRTPRCCAANKHIIAFVRLHLSTIFKISQELKSTEGFRTMKRLTQKLRERRPAHCGHQTRQVESGLEASRNVSSHPVNPVNVVLLLP